MEAYKQPMPITLTYAQLDTLFKGLMAGYLEELSKQIYLEEMLNSKKPLKVEKFMSRTEVSLTGEAKEKWIKCEMEASEARAKNFQDLFGVITAEMEKRLALDT